MRSKLAAVIAAFALTMSWALVVFADAGNPITGTINAVTLTQDADTVTVAVQGEWNWLSHNSDCNVDRAATGVGIIWNDFNGAPKAGGAYQRGNNETQKITISGAPTGGTFTLKFGTSTSAAIAWNASSGAVDSALEAMTSIGAGNVSVTGGPGPGTPWSVEFTGSLAKTNVAQMTVGPKSFTGGNKPNVAVTTTAGGSIAVTNGFLVQNGSVAAYVGTQFPTTQTAIDRMVHPVDIGNVKQGLPGAAGQQFVDPNPSDPNSFGAWRGGCGKEPLTGGPYPGHPYGSWGYQPDSAANPHNPTNGGKGWSHTYLKKLSDDTSGLPEQICVNFYDVHGGGTGAAFQKVKNSSEVTVDLAGDNSIDTNAFNVTDGANCIKLFVESPGIHLEKSASPATVTVGGSVTYSYDVTNTGNVELSNIGVVDNIGTTTCSPVDPVLSGGHNSGDTNGDDTLAITGETWHFTCTSTFSQVVTNPHTNTAEASGTSPGGVTVQDQDSASVTVDKAQPTITTTATVSVVVPGKIHDVAHLADGVSLDNTGTITFKLFSDDNCANQVGGDIAATAATVNANGDYTSDDQTVGAGTYYWRAFFSGDANNEAADTACNDTDETSTVEKAQPTLTTTATATAVLPDTISDVAHLADGVNLDNTGTITFKLFSDSSCTTQVGGVIAATPVTVNANGDYTSDAQAVGAGKYYWRAFFSGDTQNKSAETPCGTDADHETSTVLSPSIDVSKTPASQSVPLGGTAHFTISVTNNGDARLTDVEVTDAQAPDCGRTPAETAVLISTKYGAGHTYLDPGESFTYDCSLDNVQSAFVNVVEACGIDPLSNQVCDTDDNGGDPPPDCATAGSTEADRCAFVGIASLGSSQDFVPNDTGTVTVTPSGGPAPNGNLTFKLYKGTTCDAGNLIYAPAAIAVNGSGSATTTNTSLLSALNFAKFVDSSTAGTYKWQISYSGDTNGNADITGACGTEHFEVTNN